MNFADPKFWVILLIGITIISGFRVWIPTRLLENWRFDQISLICLGLILLGTVSATSLFVFVYVTCITFLLLKLLTITSWFHAHQRLSISLLLLFQLWPLVLYKYGNFICSDVFLSPVSSLQHLIIPVGVSFYTFQMVGFSIDTLKRRQPLPKWYEFVNFAGFFPQIVAGPIERRDHLLPQIINFRWKWNAFNIDAGFPWLIHGLFLKLVLADGISSLQFADLGRGAYAIWIDNLAFGFRIYFDFAGYSFIALGVAKMLGISLTMNFASPYCAWCIQDFWRRWHVTLSNWFRDYVYFPLGGSRSKLVWVNLLIVFVISGIWHGAGWNFFFWGLYHGLLLVIYHLVGSKISIPKVIQWAVTFILVILSWEFFRSTSLPTLAHNLAEMTNPSAYQLDAIRASYRSILRPEGLSLMILITGCMGVVFLEWLSLKVKNQHYHYFHNNIAMCLMILAIVLFTPITQNEFIYFAF